jgi:hypothetical protein
MKTSRFATIAVVLLAGGVLRLNAQTSVDLSRQGKLGAGISVPSQCVVGQVFLKTDAPAGANLYSCTSANSWSVVGLIPLGGDTSGTAPAATVTGLQGRPVSAAGPSDQDGLRWNAASGQWIPEAVVSVGTASPAATCTTGGLYLRNDTANNLHQLYVCSATNVWSMASIQAGTASGRPVNCLLGQTWLATDTGTMTYCSASGNPGTWSATLAGPAGPQGPQGPAGATGPQGPAGANGSAGTSGNTVWNGTVVPPAGTGANGDFYILNPTTAPCLYGPKASGSWPGTCVSMVGQTGTAGTNGNTIISGAGAPSNGVGANGDFYYRLDIYCLYGPKAGGVWPGAWTSMVGPAGAAGPTGPQGPQGPSGGLGGSNGQIPYNNNGTAAGSNLSQNSDGSVSAGKAFNWPLCTVTLSATPVFDASQCNVFSLTLGNTTVTGSSLTNAKAGQTLTFTVIQDATGGRTFVWPPNVLGGCTVSTTASATTTVSGIFDGTNVVNPVCSTSDAATAWSGPVRTALGTPAAGLNTWFDATGLNFQAKNAAGNISGTAFALTNATHKWLNSFDPTMGTFTQTQPAFSDLSDAAAPAIGAATAASLLATGIVDGKAPLTITTGSSATLGGTYNSGYTLNQESTPATAVTYTLPAAAAGKQFCIKNSYNGTAGTTGALRFSTSGAGQYIIYNGNLSGSNGYLISAGALGDSACLVGVDATHWEAYIQVGAWTLH